MSRWLEWAAVMIGRSRDEFSKCVHAKKFIDKANTCHLAGAAVRSHAFRTQVSYSHKSIDRFLTLIYIAPHDSTATQQSTARNAARRSAAIRSALSCAAPVPNHASLSNRAPLAPTRLPTRPSNSSPVPTPTTTSSISPALLSPARAPTSQPPSRRTSPLS